VLFHQSFGFAKLGEPIIYNNEMTKIALAVSRGSFKEQYGVGFGPDWKVAFSKD
jgi:S-adenosylmethionine hydrolase